MIDQELQVLVLALVSRRQGMICEETQGKPCLAKREALLHSHRPPPPSL